MSILLDRYFTSYIMVKLLNIISFFLKNEYETIIPCYFNNITIIKISNLIVIKKLK